LCNAKLVWWTGTQCLDTRLCDCGIGFLRSKKVYKGCRGSFAYAYSNQ